MRIWIDATSPQSVLPVFGMTLVERHLATLASIGLEKAEVMIALPAEAPERPVLPTALTKKLHVRWLAEPGSLQERLGRALQEKPDEPLLALEGDAIIDARLLQYLAAQSGAMAVCAGDGTVRTAVLRLEGQLPLSDTVEGRLSRLADLCFVRKTLASLPLASVPSYIKKLRRDLPIYLFRVTDAVSRDRAERFLFWSNYKGSTDFFTKYVYPPLVWRMVRPLTRWRVHPNSVTAVSIVATFLAVPFFAWEWWWTGFALSYVMSVLDSVDGKVARLTFTSSSLGNVLDHGLDIVHPPLWYFGWAWGLSQGATDSLVFQAAIWMLVVYAFDRIVAAVFNKRVGKSIHGYKPLDERMRTIISRRNINLPVFILGWLLGFPVQTFLLIVLWQIVCFVFHVERLVQFWNDGHVAASAT